MQDSTNLSDLFSLSADDFKADERKESDFYKPSPDKGKEGVYKSIVRFIPWYKNPKHKSLIKKFSYWLTDPTSGDGFSVDCPSTIGEKSILQDTFWKLKNSKSVAEQELASKFSRKENYFALIQIIKDENNPSLEGKIKIWKFGKKIWEKIDGEIHPEMGKSRVPFNLFASRPFLISVKKVGDWPNYDSCKFLDDELAFKINGSTVPSTEDGLQIIQGYLKDNSPDLEAACGFRPWSEEDKARIISVIKNTVPSMRDASEMISHNKQSKPAGQASTTHQKPAASVSDFDDEINSVVGAASIDDDFDTNTVGDIDEDLYANL